MDVMSTVDRYGDPKCRSDRGDNVLQSQGAVGNDECVPRFGGSTDECFAMEGEVQAEDFEGEPALLLRDITSGGHRFICVYELPANQRLP